MESDTHRRPQEDDIKGVTRLLVVAEVRLYREGLQAALGARSQFVVVGVACTADETFRQIETLSPGIVIIDMATRHCLDLARAIDERAPSTRVVAFGVNEFEGDVLACAEAGLAGYVPSDASIDDLVKRIECVARGELLCSPKIAAALFRTWPNRQPAPTGRPQVLGLTSREREVLRLMSSGLSNKEIAVHLYVEVCTVKNHVHHILDKLDVSSRAQAVAKMTSSPQPSTLRPGLRA